MNVLITFIIIYTTDCFFSFHNKHKWRTETWGVTDFNKLLCETAETGRKLDQ